MKVTFKTGSEANYGSTNGELFFASNTKQIMLNGIKYIPKKLSELTNDSGFISSITKSMVEGVLTGNIISHTHDYLPLNGGTLNGNLTCNGTITATTFNGNLNGNADNASKLSSHSISELTYASIFTYTSNRGILVQTDFNASSDAHVCAHIWGSGYNSLKPINTYIQFLNYNNINEIINYACFHYGLDLGNVYAFSYNGNLCFWFDISKWIYQTIYVFVGTNSGDVINHVTSLSNVLKPTDGVTREVAITPKLNAFIDSNVASATKFATARTIKVGSAFKSFDGSGDIEFTLNSIITQSDTINVGTLNVAGDAKITGALTVSGDISGDISGELTNKLSITIGSTTTTYDNTGNKSINITPSAIGALENKFIVTKNSYQRYVILLCKTGTNTTNTGHTINGTFYTHQGGAQRYQAAYVNIHSADWSVSHNEYYGFTPFGIGSKCRLVTCTYQDAQYLAITFENTPETKIYFDGSSINILFTPILYYTENTQTINNPEIYNSIADVVYNKTSIITSLETALTSSNFNSYSPKLDGTGATGTWGINISGNAYYATSAGVASEAKSVENPLSITLGTSTTPTSYNGSAAISLSITPSAIGLGNVQNTAFYQRQTFVNGTQWNMAGTYNGDAFKIFAPTEVGTSGYILQSSGSGAPIWANPTYLTVGSATNASKLSSHTISELTYASIYTGYQNYGILVQTDFNATSNSQVCAHIWGNGYNANMPINTYIQFYNYNDGNSIIDYACDHYGLNLGNVYVFNYNGKVCFWFDVSKWMYQTICVFAGTGGNSANTSYMVFNHVVSLDNVVKPTDGVTREVTIIPKVNAFLDSNVASASKLATSRTLWGQSFNGTANIDGSITLSTSTTAVEISRGMRETSSSGFIGFSYKNKATGDEFNGISLGWGANPETSGASVRINSSTFTYKGSEVLRTDNFNSYAPKLDGTGAIGTWGINISGNANYATSAGVASQASYVENSLSITLGTSTTPTSYNGSAGVELKITPSAIGAADASHTHTFASLTGKPTTLGGYGITDAYTKTETNTELGKYLPLTGGTLNGALTLPKLTSTGGIVLGDSSLSAMVGSVGIQRYDETGFIGFLKDFNLGNSFNGVVIGWDGNYQLSTNSVRIDASTFTYKGNSVLHSGNLGYNSSGLSRAVQKDASGNLFIVAPSLFEQGISNNYPKNLRWSNETEGQLVYDTEETAGNSTTVEVSIPVANGTSKGFLKSTSTVTNVTGYTPCPVVSGTPYYKEDCLYLGSTEIGYTGIMEYGIQYTFNYGTKLPYLEDYTPDSIPRCVVLCFPDRSSNYRFLFWLSAFDEGDPYIARFYNSAYETWLTIDTASRQIILSYGNTWQS